MAETDKSREVSSEEAAAIAAAQIGDPEFEDKLKELSPEQIQVFVAALGQAVRKRKIMLLGYLSALTSVVLGMVFALIMYARHERGTFIGWVFLVPFIMAATSMLVFGRLANRIKITVGDVQIDTDGKTVGPASDNKNK